MEIPKCPICGNQGWSEGYFECEDCGDHSAVRCTKCWKNYDHVWNDRIYNAVLIAYGVDLPDELPKGE